MAKKKVDLDMNATAEERTSQARLELPSDDMERVHPPGRTGEDRRRREEDGNEVIHG
jgi:hypothetical protein